MYTKGQEAERISHSSKVMSIYFVSFEVNGIRHHLCLQVLEVARAAPSRVTVPELMQQLQVTQDELDNLRVSQYYVIHINFIVFTN